MQHIAARLRLVLLPARVRRFRCHCALSKHQKASVESCLTGVPLWSLFVRSDPFGSLPISAYMDWVDTTDDTIEAAAASRQTFEIVRPVPTQATARVQIIQTGKGKDRHQALLQGKLAEISHASIESACEYKYRYHAENLLHAFPPVFPNESSEVRALRLAAYKQCWSAISQNLEVRSDICFVTGIQALTKDAVWLALQNILEESNQATFQALLHFAAAAHQAPDMCSSFVQRSRIIPTALTFAGGVNSADHAQTFPTLVKLLRQQVSIASSPTGCRTRLMKLRSLCMRLQPEAPCCQQQLCNVLVNMQV